MITAEECFIFIKGEETVKDGFAIKDVERLILEKFAKRHMSKHIKDNNYKETKFHNYFKKNIKISGCILVKSEFILKDPNSLFKREISLVGLSGNSIKEGRTIGKIDVLFKHRSILYCGEIKWTLPRSDFWSAMKVLGYCSYYNWQNEIWEGSDPARPAILIPIKHIKLEHKIISNKLKIALFGIIEGKNDDYFLELINP